MERFRRVEGCLDYRIYVCSLAGMRSDQMRVELCSRLGGLGRAEPERMGVIYIRGGWGFLVIPPVGFPELKVTVFRETEPETEHAVLSQIADILGT